MTWGPADATPRRVTRLALALAGAVACVVTAGPLTVASAVPSAERLRKQDFPTTAQAERAVGGRDLAGWEDKQVDGALIRYYFAQSDPVMPRYALTASRSANGSADTGEADVLSDSTCWRIEATRASLAEVCFGSLNGQPVMLSYAGVLRSGTVFTAVGILGREAPPTARQREAEARALAGLRDALVRKAIR